MLYILAHIPTSGEKTITLNSMAAEQLTLNPGLSCVLPYRLPARPFVQAASVALADTA